MARSAFERELLQTDTAQKSNEEIDANRQSVGLAVGLDVGLRSTAIAPSLSVLKCSTSLASSADKGGMKGGMERGMKDDVSGMKRASRHPVAAPSCGTQLVTADMKIICHNLWQITS